MKQSQPQGSLHILAFNALVGPILVAAVLTALAGVLSDRLGYTFLTSSNGVILGGLGVGALLYGLRQYGWDGLSFRNGRPVFAGIGFAFVGWIGFLVARAVSVGIDVETVEPNLGITFLFLLIFEAFCVQLWTYGLFFRALADWRNPFSAVLLSGTLFGFVGWFLFGESFAVSYALPYFVIWGLLYGMIRLRTGSFLGVALVQAMQSLTAWHLLPAKEPFGLAWLYGLSGLVYVILIWRLWPKFVSDLRV